MKEQSTIACIPLEEVCFVCSRVRWGAYQVLGFGKWRHDECYPGSKAWLEAMEEKRAHHVKLTEEQSTIYNHHKGEL